MFEYRISIRGTKKRDFIARSILFFFFLLLKEIIRASLSRYALHFARSRIPPPCYLRIRETKPSSMDFLHYIARDLFSLHDDTNNGTRDRYRIYSTCKQILLLPPFSQIVNSVVFVTWTASASPDFLSRNRHTSRNRWSGNSKHARHEKGKWFEFAVFRRIKEAFPRLHIFVPKFDSNPRFNSLQI